MVFTFIIIEIISICAEFIQYINSVENAEDDLDKGKSSN
jgi:hypothetical protein